MEDSLTHKKIENRGQLLKYYYQDTHPAIIDRATWEAAQKETARRQAEFWRPRHPFSRLIKCGICGKSYCHKAGKRSRAKWGCLDKEKATGSCKNFNVMDSELLKACNNVLGLEEFDEAIFKDKVKKIIVQPEGILEFHFHDGEIKREKFITDKVELRRQVVPIALYQGIEICCGIHGHRLWHALINGRHYWKCGLKVQHKVDCDCWSHITGTKVLQMVKKLTSRDDITYENLAEVVEKSIVMPDNTIEFHFKDGRIEKCPKP